MIWGGSECSELGTEQCNPTRSEQSRAHPWAPPQGRVVPVGRGQAGRWGHAGHKQQSTAQGLETRHYPDSTSKSIKDKSQLAYSRGAALQKARGLVFSLKGKGGKRSVSESQVKHGWGTAALGRARSSSPHTALQAEPRGADHASPVAVMRVRAGRCCGATAAAAELTQRPWLCSREGQREENQKYSREGKKRRHGKLEFPWVAKSRPSTALGAAEAEQAVLGVLWMRGRRSRPCSPPPQRRSPAQSFGVSQPPARALCLL